MKPITSYQGIVLKTTDYKEQAQIVSILTKDGLKNFQLKGSKKITSGTRLLSIVPSLITFNGTNTSGLDTITEGILVNDYASIKENMDKMLFASCIIEKILVFSQQITETVKFYDFCIELFKKLDTTINPMLLLTIFELKLTYLIGIAPSLNYCLKCGKKLDDAYFRVIDGGCYDEICLDNKSYDLSSNQTKILKLLYLIKLENVNDELYNLVESELLNLSKIIDYFYQYHLGFTSNAKRIAFEISCKRVEKNS